MLDTEFPPWPAYDKAEATAIYNVLLSNAVNYWTGDEGRQFEIEFATWTGARYAIALSNGTVALEAALHAMGIGPGDEVVVTPRSFIASASCVVLAGAKPVFADVDADTQNLTAETIEAVLTPNCRAVICVHVAGMPCDMDPIVNLAKERGLFIIEDCAQAHGAQYKDRSVGTIGHIGTWSFCQDKIITTGGEGGMVTTNDTGLWERMWSYKDHGKSWATVYERTHPPGFRWLHESIGTNGRMLELQAVLGRLQLRRMKEWSRKRLEYAATIWNAAADLRGLHVPPVPPWAKHAAYKCYVFVKSEELKAGWNRDGIMRAINERRVPCYSGICPEIYREKAFAGRGLTPSDALPVAKRLGESSLMFLVHPTLTEEHISRTCTALAEVMREAVGAPDTPAA